MIALSLSEIKKNIMETVFLPVPPDSIVSWTTERLKMQTIC
jgi:hypothetical protein